MNSFLLTAEEVSTELAEALKDVTKEQAFTGGTVLGMALGMAVTFGIIIFILQVIADWKIFTKAGRPGWKSIIPFLNYYEEYDLSWRGKGMLGIIFAVLELCASAIDYYTPDPTPTWAYIVSLVIAVFALALSIMQSSRLSKAFGKGVGFTVGLVLLQPIFRLILGFGDAEYQGPQD